MAKNMSCLFCGSDHGVVMHHIRKGSYCGTSLKPSDNISVPLCFYHHDAVHRFGEETIFLKHGWTIDEAKEFANKIYDRYKENSKK